MVAVSGAGSVYENPKPRGKGTKWIGEYKSKGIRVYGPTKGEAAEKLRARIAEADAPRQPAKRGRTVGDVFDLWLDVGLAAHKKGGRPLADGTRANHEWAVERLRAVELDVGPLVAVKVSELRPSHVSEALEVICRYKVPKSKAAATKASGRPRKASGGTGDVLGEEALKRIRSVFSLALAFAIRRDWLDTNPAKAADIPGIAKAPGRRGHLEAKAADKLEAGLRDDPDGALFYLMLRTGLRPEEAYALSVDSLNGRLLNVWRSVRRTHARNTEGDGPRNRTGREIVEELKNSASRRTIELTADVVEVLKAHLKRDAERIRAAKADGQTPLIFAAPNGGIVDDKAANRTLAAICERLGVYATQTDKRPTLPTMYELRHTAATVIMDTIQNPVAVSDLLGNKDTRMVMTRYRHVDERRPRTALVEADRHR